MQSSEYSPEQIRIHIQTFLDNYKSKIADISDEEFDKWLNGVIKDLKYVDMNIFETKDRLWGYISDHSYHFDKQGDLISELNYMLEK